MQEETIVKVEHLSKRFGQFEAVKDVSFTVNRGDVVGFLGPNGAGKSTTIRCLLSLITPDSGKIELFGSTYQQNRRGILARIGSIIEKPDFYKYLSAEKNLEIFARISGKDVSKKEIQEMLEFVGLGDRGKHKVGGFSHGMKQRLGIAQTLLHQPDLIVLDEPTTGLDPQGIIEIRNLILRLKNEQHKTILLSSHQLSEIELIANKMVIINKGLSLVEGEVSELLNTTEMVVRIEMTSTDGARELIMNHFQDVDIKSMTSTEIELVTNRNDVTKINQCLVENGFEIEALEPKRKLEDFFIKTIQS